MKILNERDKFLSDYEVLKHLKEIKTKYNWTFNEDDEKTLQDKPKHKQRRFTGCGLNLEVITRDTIAYLDKSPCSEIKFDQSFTDLMLFLNKFDFVKIEKLQIVNTLPRNLVTLYALVDEFDLRFGQDVGESILERINELFPLPDEAEEEEEVAEEEEAGEGDEVEEV